MIFPRNYSTEDYASKTNAVNSSLSEFTLCFFVKMKDVTTHSSQIIYSYYSDKGSENIHGMLVNLQNIGKR